MPRAKQLSPRGMGNTPSQLYVIAKILKDKSLIKQYFYNGNRCSRGHTLRRLNEHWCLHCAKSIITGKLGVDSHDDIKGEYYSPYLKWIDNVDNKTVEKCWYRKVRKSSSSQAMPTYKKPTNSFPEYITPGKAAYNWFWGDVGGLKIEKMCKDPDCVNPFHIYSCFNYHDQIVHPAPFFNLNKEEELPFYHFEVLNYMIKQRAIAPVHELLRLLLDRSYASKAFYNGFPCPWGHTMRHKEDHWCVVCAVRIMANQVGFDIDYLIPSYRHELNKYLKILPLQNIPSNSPESDQEACWVVPPETIHPTYRFYKYDTEDKKDACMTFPKMIYTLFWGDIGRIKVKRTCNNKCCYNPRHYASCFNCPDDIPPLIQYANFTSSVKRAAAITKKRKRHNEERKLMPLPWEENPVSPPASGDTTSQAATVTAANTINKITLSAPT